MPRRIIAAVLFDGN